ncbi:MAG: DUF255 domain-containing protein [Thermoplasmata archaeon]|nr:DUF255 domain-containing protein [Thermoplasmata archaeon]
MRWREWSKVAFDEARRENKLVLLDLSAVWCHWCHVMDDTTYADREVARRINESFIPVRVDIDERPDISERYNRGGFPTTAFLSDRGESIWGATYIPPADMKRIMGSILAAKASGEIDRALEKTRLQYLDLSRRFRPKRILDAKTLSALFEDIFSIYDVEWGGFGTQPKFPHPDVLNLLLEEYANTKQDDLANAVKNTLDGMIDGIFDRIEGGVYRYSVTRDWRTPHFEKMLETNAGFLRNLARASIALGAERYADIARHEVKYLLSALRNPESGGFFGSQAADEDYYKLQPEARAKSNPPPVDRRIYAGWNAQAISALIEAGALLREPTWIQAGLDAWKYALSRLWDPERKLIRHMEAHDEYLFEDQAEFLDAALAVLEVSGSEEIPKTIEDLIAGADRFFADPDGGYGDIVSEQDSIGELGSARKSLVSNSKWARGLALYGAASHNDRLIEKADATLSAFTVDEAEAHGLFAAGFITVARLLARGPTLVEIHGDGRAPWEDTFWVTSKKALEPGTITLMSMSERSNTPYALVCTQSGCYSRILDPDKLTEALKRQESSQA